MALITTTNSSSGILLEPGMCRVCLHEKGIVSLFDNGRDELFRYCTQLDIAETDDLPNHLCENCSSNMRIAYDFRFQALYADNYFRQTIFLPLEDEDEDDDGVENAREKVDIYEDSFDVLMDNIAAHVIGGNEVKTGPESSLLGDTRGLNEFTGDLDSNGFSNNFYDAFDPAGITNINASTALVVPPHPLEDHSQFHPKEIEASREEPVKSSPTTAKKPAPQKEQSKIECNICGSTFTHINSLRTHLVKHSGERPFKCEFCLKSFARRTVLNIHRRIHTGERPYACNECVGKFTTKEALQRHKDREHKEDANDPVISNQPTTSSDSTTPAKKDKPRSTKSRKFSEDKPRRPSKSMDSNNGSLLPSIKYCPICDEGFPSKWELKSHQKEHELTHTHKCTVCSAMFEKKFMLLCHLETHENGKDLAAREATHQPDIEGNDNTNISDNDYDDDDDQPLAKIFSVDKSKRSGASRQGRLKTNVDVEKVLKCHKCYKNFLTKKDLDSHKSVHNDIPVTFDCTVCGKSFSRKGILNLHKVRHKEII